jgi:RNA polymerase sigma-70 factor (ECF subfamily)
MERQPDVSLPERTLTPADKISKWLEAARGGDEDAFGYLLEACRPYLLSLAKQRIHGDLKPRLGSSDIVQDTFIDAQRAFARFQGSSEIELRAWLKTILLTNVAQSYADNYRKKRALNAEVRLADLPSVEPESGVISRNETPSYKARVNERDEALQSAMESLPEPYRDVIRLHSYERYTFEEIGRRMGRSDDAIRKLWTRAIDKLREVLDATHGTQ